MLIPDSALFVAGILEPVDVDGRPRCLGVGANPDDAPPDWDYHRSMRCGLWSLILAVMNCLVFDVLCWGAFVAVLFVSLSSSFISISLQGPCQEPRSQQCLCSAGSSCKGSRNKSSGCCCCCCCTIVPHLPNLWWRSRGGWFAAGSYGCCPQWHVRATSIVAVVNSTTAMIIFSGRHIMCCCCPLQ